MAIDKSKAYTQIQIAYRAQFLQLQKSLEKEYGQIAVELNDRIQDVIKKYASVDGVITKKIMDDINRELDRVARWFSVTTTSWLDRNITKSIDLAVTGQDAAAMYYIKSLIADYGGEVAATLSGLLKDPKSPLLLRQSFGTGLDRAIRNRVWQHRWEGSFALSDRIWTIDGTLRQNLHDMIEQCANQGLSAVEFSRAVEQYLEVPGPKWTTKIKPAVTDRGTIKYNSLRLARTETNQGYHRAQHLSSESSSLVKAIKWNLSKSHPDYSKHKSYAYMGYPEICDYRALADHHGLGPGVFPKGEVPFDHPNGLCYLTDVLYQGAELIRQLEKIYKVA